MNLKQKTASAGANIIKNFYQLHNDLDITKNIKVG
jgi:hypothetical protein